MFVCVCGGGGGGGGGGGVRGGGQLRGCSGRESLPLSPA